MWVPGSVAYLGPLFALALRQLFGNEERAGVKSVPAPGETSPKARRPKREAFSAQIARHADGAGRRLARARRRPAPGFDLLRAPLIGRFLRWPRGRTVLQGAMFLLAAAVIYDGLRGPEFGPMNLAGVLPWIHWRGVLVVGLLAAGNIGCLACPFTLPRRLGRRWLPASWHWPRLLRSKWLAVCLLAVFFWAYEEFSLWDHPARTAWIAAGYFAAAFAVDGLFRGASFCKYVCPIGQFNFIQSLVSPLEVKVREPAACAACRTKECIRGAANAPGCELQLLVPQKSSNMDCTFCLDCVHACPHANVGLLAVSPGHALWSVSPHDGLGRLAGRTDLAALALVLTFGAFANAAGMVAPVVQALDRLRFVVGSSWALCVTPGFYLAAVIVGPAILVAIATALSCSGDRLQAVRRFSYALVPLGFSMWVAHYSFHFFTSYDAAIPVIQRFLGDLGLSSLGEPHWVCGCCRPAADWLLHAELLFLDFGLLLSLYAAYRIACDQRPAGEKLVRTLAPWSLLIAGLFFAGVWILLQPMEMRGTLPGA